MEVRLVARVPPVLGGDEMFALPLAGMSETPGFVYTVYANDDPSVSGAPLLCPAPPVRFCLFLLFP